MSQTADNVFVESIKILLSDFLSGPTPHVIWTAPTMADVVELLPEDWERDAVDPSEFASEVTAALASQSVVAFPPWGQSNGAREPQEAAAVRGIHPGPPGHPLLLLLPYNVLIAASAKPLRTQLSETWHIRAIVSLRGGLPGLHRAFTYSLVLLESLDAAPGVLRMFDPTQSHADERTIIEDLRRLTRMEGGCSEYGFVLREYPLPGSSWHTRHHDPRLTQRRRELADFGDVAHIDHLFVVSGNQDPPARASGSKSVGADTPGAMRVITGRDVLRSHDVAPADDKSRYTTDDRYELHPGDVVVRGLHPINSVWPGIVWARVTKDDLPLAAGPNVVILRPRPHANPDDIEFALRFISSDAALELSDDPRLPPATTVIRPSALAGLRIPLPDEALKEALASVEQARARAAAWSDEADQILSGLFDYDSAVEARQRVLERSRLVRLRMKAVDDVETLGGQVRRQYPLPIAYRWRALEAALSQGHTRDAYLAALDWAEQTFAFMANIGLALAREVHRPVSTVADISERLRRGQGTSMSDWCNILDELAGKPFSEIDTAISTPEFRNFCKSPQVRAARKDLLRRRNDEAHGRRVELVDLDTAISTTLESLTTINHALEFLLDNPLIVVRNLRWDTLQNEGELAYQVLAGDHAVVPIQQMRVTTSTVEADSLYLLDSKRSLHLLRPYLTGAHCRRCGSFSVFHIDQHRNSTLTIKSLEHGHFVEASPSLVHAFASTDFDLQGDGISGS